MKGRAGLGKQMQRPNHRECWGWERRKSQGRHDGEKFPRGTGKADNPAG